MKKLSSKNNNKKNDKMKEISEIDNEFFFRGDFDNKKFSDLNETEVESLVAYIMRHWLQS